MLECRNYKCKIMDDPDWLLALAIIIVRCAETGLISFLPLGDIVQGWWLAAEIIGTCTADEARNQFYMEGKVQGYSKATFPPYFRLFIRLIN
jgi:hypothetical protein